MAQVEDPYRWLEDADSQETKTFVKEQNELTEKYLAQWDKHSQIKDSMAKLWLDQNFDRIPRKFGQYYYTCKEVGFDSDP